MTKGGFAALADDSESDSEASKDPVVQPHSSVNVPSYEDLSSIREDEVTVLEAVYGEDFQKSKSVWGCPKFEVACRPADVGNVGSSVT